MHVVLYTDDPDRGGVATYNHLVAMGLREAGHRVTLVQTRSASPAVRAREAAGIEHAWISYDTGAELARTIGDSSDAFRAFARLAPDVVVFSDACAISNIAAKHVAVSRRLPFITVVHYAARYLAERFPRVLPAVREHLARASAVVAVSSETLAVTRRWFGLAADRGTVIFNGVPPALFAPRDEARREQLRARLGIPDDAVVSVTTARLTEVKGHGLQLDALELVRARHPALAPICLWVGDGELRAPLQAHVAARGLEHHVQLVGMQLDVAAWLDAADLFTLTSFVEGMPMSIMEAMARGLPVVATAVSGVPEELGDTGALLPDPLLDPAATCAQLAAIWEAWAADAGLRRRLGDTGRTRAVQWFRADEMVARVKQLVEHVAAITTSA